MKEIDLSRLPPPNVVVPLDFEAELARLKALVLQEVPTLADVIHLESEPVNKILQRIAYEYVNMQQRINDAAKACMLAYALGEDLDQMAANLLTPRLDNEPDAALRRRAQMSNEGETAAGSYGSYMYHGLSAHADVLDVSVDSPKPGDVRVTVLSRHGQGQADGALLQVVEQALSADDVRPLSDTVMVQSAQIVHFAVQAVLSVYPGPAAQPLLQAAMAALDAYLQEHRKLGHDITRSALYAALHQSGVHNVQLLQPAQDVVIDPTQAAWCTAVDVTLGASDV